MDSLTRKELIEAAKGHISKKWLIYATGRWLLGTKEIAAAYGYKSARAANRAIEAGQVWAAKVGSEWISNTGWQKWGPILPMVGMSLWGEEGEEYP